MSNFPSMNGGRTRVKPDYATILAAHKASNKTPRFFSMGATSAEIQARREYEAAMKQYNADVAQDVRVMRAELLARGIDPDSAA